MQKLFNGVYLYKGITISFNQSTFGNYYMFHLNDRLNKAYTLNETKKSINKILLNTKGEK